MEYFMMDDEEKETFLENLVKESTSSHILDIPPMRISRLPALPHKLKELSVRGVYFKEGILPSLPTTLQILDCYECNLIQLPELPKTLTYLDCSKNKLCYLPTLPSKLVILYCEQTLIQCFPEIPESLTLLDCSNNSGLRFLPKELHNVQEIRCDNCILTKLPQLPSTLKKINCTDNRLTELPELPNGLELLSCDRNLLTVLPTIPKSLQFFTCSKNKLSTLPRLPYTLRYIAWGGNKWNAKFAQIMLSTSPIHSINLWYDVLHLKKNIHRTRNIYYAFQGNAFPEDIVEIVHSFQSGSKIPMAKYVEQLKSTIQTKERDFHDNVQ